MEGAWPWSPLGFDLALRTRRAGCCFKPLSLWELVTEAPGDEHNPLFSVTSVTLPTMPFTESIKCLLIDRQLPQPEDHQIGPFKGGHLLGPRSDGEGKPEEQSWAVGGNQPGETQDTKRFWRQTRGTSEATGIWVALGGGAASQPLGTCAGCELDSTGLNMGRAKPPQAGTSTRLGGQEGAHGGPTTGCSTACREAG